MTILASRINELTAVVNRTLFDAVPSGITNPIDILRWERFRERYHTVAETLQHYDFPLQLDFELNSTCNLRCAFCLHGHEKVPRRSLSFEQFARVIREGEAFGLCSVKLNYINEPLLVPNICEYIDYARLHGVLNVYFATNGTLLTEAMIRSLIASRVSKVMISLDAVTPETFLIMRQSTKLELITQNILNLIRIREELGVNYPLVRVNFLKTEQNMHEAEQFIEQWTGVADMIGFQDRVGLPGVDSDTVSLLPVLLPEKTGFRCSFPSKQMVIDSSGQILPCCTFSGRSLPMGNIEQTTVKQAWDSVRMEELRDLHAEGKYAENSVCRHCVNSCVAD